MAGKGIGNLWVTVGADVKPAMKAIDQLNKKAMRSGQILDKAVGGNRTGRGTDQLNAKLKGLGNQYDKTSKQAKKSGEAIKKSGDGAKKASVPIGQLQGAMYRLSQSFINLRYGNPIGVFAGLTQAFTQLGRGVSGAAVALPAIATGIGAVVVVAAAAAAGVTLLAGAFAKFGLKEATNLEMLRIQYEGLLDSASRGAAEVEYILNLGKTSVVPTEGLLEANRLLLAYGVTVDETRQSLVKFFSDFGSATGLSSARLQDMAYALGQVEAQGRANAIDLRQLANAGLNLALVYEKVAEQQGISVQQAKALTSEGKMTSAILIPAVVALGDNYEAAAAKARDSVRGILANLKDIAKINVATAFEGLLTKLKPLLKWVEAFMESFDFQPIADAIGNVVDMFSETFAFLAVDASNMAEKIVSIIAYAINVMGSIVNRFVNVMKLTYQIPVILGQSAALALVKLAEIWVDILVDMAEKAAEVAQYIPGPWAGAMESMASTTRSWNVSVNKSLENVQKNFNSTAESVSSTWSAITAPWTFNTTPQGSGSSVGELPALTKPAVPSIDEGGAGKKQADALKDAMEELNSVVQQFRDLSAKPLGSDSAIEKALTFNADTYQGNSSQIVSMYTKMRGAAADYYNLLIEQAPKAQKVALRAERASVVGSIEASYQALYDLSERNAALQKELTDFQKAETTRLTDLVKSEKAAYDLSVKSTEDYYDAQILAAESALDQATRAYDSANSKLQALISERDNYLSGIRQSAFSFVNSLTDANEAISSVTDLDGLGSFSSVTGEGTTDFKAQLQSRLDAVKQWRSDIESLMARGLDRNMLDALIAGGPDGSGALATALANETDAGIAEINSIQSELTSTVAGLNQSVSAQFFDAGIAQQQAYTNQMAANVETAKAYLQSQKDLRDQALEQLRTDYEARRDELEAQIKAVEASEDEHSVKLIGMMQANAKTAEEIGKKIQDTTAALSNKKKKNNLFDLGEKAIKGLIDGMNAQRRQAVLTARSIANAIKAEMKGAFQIQSPSRVMMGYGENITEGLAIGMENGISKVDMAAARVANAAFISGDAPKQSAPTVKVFIGDQELRDLVDVQITDASGRDLDTAYAGRRDF